MKLVTVIQTTLTNAMRSVQALVSGNKTTGISGTPTECLPYGFDSCPIPGIVAAYTVTENNRQPGVILGYVNKNQIAQPGESRVYSTDTTGTVKYFVYLQADKITIGTGTPANHFTQYEALNTALVTGGDALVTQINNQLTEIAAGIAAAGGTYTPTDITLDISAAETTNILTN